MRTFKQLGLLIAILSAVLPAAAYDFEDNGLYYSILSTTDLTCALVKGDKTYAGTIIIPETASYKGKELKVVSIDCRLEEVDSVVIGHNVETIGKMTFDSAKIKHITLPESVKNIGEQAFYHSKLESAEIQGNSVFEANVFWDCTNLESVVFADSMNLGRSQFSGCKNLRNLSYKEICTEIPPRAFENCELLTGLDFRSVKWIGSYAFDGCESLDTLNLSSITYIGSRAFANCGRLGLVIIGPEMTLLTGNDVWGNCTIDSLHFADSKVPLVVTSDTNTGSPYPQVKESPLNNCNITKLYLGRNVTYWFEYYQEYGDRKLYYSPNPFHSQTTLTSVRIGSLVSKLDYLDTWYTSAPYTSQGYFSLCSKLANVDFDKESSLTEISTSAFSGCDSLVTIERP